MQVSAGMSDVVLTVNPGHTLRDAARAMAERGVGAAVVIDLEQPGPGIVTERDILQSIGKGENPDDERVGDHLSRRARLRGARTGRSSARPRRWSGVAFATSSWSTAAR